MSITPDIRIVLNSYLVGLADWRRARYNDDLHDPRNLQSAEGLIDLGRYVLTLPETEDRLTRLAGLCLHGDEFLPGQQTAYEVGRFRFHDSSATLDGFLSRMVELAELDQRETGQFGGPQVPGDEPW